MDITHVSNSFLIVESAMTKLVCDPWVGKANHGGWRSYPEFDRRDLIDRVREANLVYISHLHSDHFDPEFLIESGLIESRFLIKAYDKGTLRRRLNALGASTIIEAAPFAPLAMRDLRLAIIPQFQSSNAGVETDIEYDLDTSLIVDADGKVFFNQVDNPMGVTHFETVKAFCDREFGPIDIAALVCGAAAEYPQCFLNIDRAAEQGRIIEAALDKLDAIVRVLQPKGVFLAGGSYFIPGALTELSRFIAQPTPGQAAERCDFVRFFALEGGGRLDLATGAVARDLTPTLTELGQVQAAHAADPYPYEAAPVPSDGELDAMFAKAKAAFEVAMIDHGVRLNIDYEFCLYHGLTERRARDGAHRRRLVLSVRTDDRTVEPTRLRLHLDARAFALCVARRQSWNQTISGSLVFQERWPNVHQPDALFALNHLVAEAEVATA